MRLIHRGGLAALLLVASPAHADPTKRECVDAATRGQTLRDDKQLSASRESLVVCSSAACPTVIRRSCAEWLADVDARLPRITVRVVDAADHDVAVTRVRIDDIEGGLSPTPVDPGVHAVEVSYRDRTLTESVKVNERESRTVVIRLPRPKAEASPPQSIRPEPEEPQRVADRSTPISVWILAGVGVVGLGGFAFFGLSARSNLDELNDPRTGCAPTCAPDRTDGARRDAIAADVSLGVSVVALAVAAIIGLSQSTQHR
jgi:hypothetical protein